MQLPAIIGKYELLEFLGGGMSHVYRGRDTLIDRPVVVKILTDEACADAEAKARFLHEARIAGNIQHENIVSVFDYGEHGGRPYIVMEYLRGLDLRDAIRGGHTGGLAERLRIATHIAAALEYVHTSGIVHRDIKPENVHIDVNGRVKLMDFGIAKTADLSLTRTGMAMGTPYYMAPEQVAGRPATPLVDVYAYGMLLFELLTGTRGITAETMEQVFFQILQQPLDVTKLESAGAPPEIRDLVMRCTAKSPEDRPRNMGEVLQVLKGGAAAPAETRPMPVAPAPSVTPSQSQVPVGRKSSRRFVIALVAVIVAIVIATMVYVWKGRIPAQPGMVYVPEGNFLAGPNKTSTQLNAFFIDETEVTNADFAEFCRATGCAVPTGAPDLPVVNITVVQARAFAKWKGKRLPTQLEWEHAARGSDGVRYPWGDAEDPTRANLRDNPTLATHGLMPAKSFKALPVYQMAGNAWEMVEGNITPSDAAVALFANLLNPPPAAQEKWIQIRGGSFNTPLAAAITYEWSPIPERYASADIGFRCAKTP